MPAVPRKKNNADRDRQVEVKKDRCQIQEVPRLAKGAGRDDAGGTRLMRYHASRLNKTRR